MCGPPSELQMSASLKSRGGWQGLLDEEGFLKRTGLKHLAGSVCENYFLLLKHIVCTQLKTVIFACFLLSIDQSQLLTVKMCMCVHIYL